jgi:hypothetical protein
MAKKQLLIELELVIFGIGLWITELMHIIFLSRIEIGIKDVYFLL